MPKLNKDEKKVQLAQKAYDEGLDKFLSIIAELNSEIVEINDLLRGYAAGDPDEKYQLSSAQYGALKERFALWKSFLTGPEKYIANVNNELREKHKAEKEEKSSTPAKKKTGNVIPHKFSMDSAES